MKRDSRGTSTGRMTTHPDKTRRRERATAREEARASRTDEEQIQRLIDRGHPDCREVKRLRARIAKADEPKVEEPADEVSE